MTAPVTMRQIAERAGVSIGTVSHVINETAKVRLFRLTMPDEVLQRSHHPPLVAKRGVALEASARPVRPMRENDRYGSSP